MFYVENTFLPFSPTQRIRQQHFSSSFFCTDGASSMHSACCLKAFDSRTKSVLPQLKWGLLVCASIIEFIYGLIRLVVVPYIRIFFFFLIETFPPLLIPWHVLMRANTRRRKQALLGAIFIQLGQLCKFYHSCIKRVTSIVPTTLLSLYTIPGKNALI